MRSKALVNGVVEWFDSHLMPPSADREFDEVILYPVAPRLSLPVNYLATTCYIRTSSTKYKGRSGIALEVRHKKSDPQPVVTVVLDPNSGRHLTTIWP